MKLEERTFGTPCILNRLRRLQVFKPFVERNLFLVFQLKLSVQVRLLSNFYTSFTTP